MRLELVDRLSQNMCCTSLPNNSLDQPFSPFPHILPMSTSEAGAKSEVFSFDISEDLVPSREQKSAGSLVLDFGGLLNPSLRLHEDLKEGNGGQAWPAGMLLATHLLKYHKNDLIGKKMFVSSSPMLREELFT